ncbi:MAG: ribosomal L7Ae/L30e/S12e/Gadd45 family protein [Firmicutes bacterium]|nr:ribosomal L7Ae/L30e/S12e/Gadd45 family protein [Bacillota bacterium]
MPVRLTHLKKTVGAKQTLKALERGNAKAVFIAKDADEYVVRPVREMCVQKGIELVYVESMMHLGKCCGIDVGASTAAVVR